MKVTSFNWAPHNGLRGWVIAPFLGFYVRVEIPTGCRHRYGMIVRFGRWK